MKSYRVTLDWACFRIDVDDEDVVTFAAPAAKWMMGHSFKHVKEWVEKKRGTVVVMP